MTRPPGARPHRSPLRRRLALPAATLALALVLPGAPAGAQDGAHPADRAGNTAMPAATPLPDSDGPISLFPPTEDDQAQADGPGPAASEPPPRAIEVQPLAAPAGDAIGLLRADQGGLGTDLWKGTQRARVAILLPLLPAGSGSPAADALAYRLLASEARPPEGGADDGVSLLALRLRRLYAAGQVQAVAEMLDRAGRAGQGDDLALLRADAALLAGDASPACAIAEAMRKQSGTAPWLRLSAFCAARQHDTAGVQLDLDLLQDANKVEQTFLDLIQAVTAAAPDPAAKPDAKPKPKSKRTRKVAPPEALTPLLYAMYRAAGIAVPDAAAAHAPLPVLRALAGDDTAAPAARLAAAERCARAGALPPDTLAQAYAAVRFDDAQFRDAAATAAKLPAALGNALLFQAIGRSSDVAAKQALLHTALARARDQGAFLPAARLYAPGIAAMTPQAGQAGFARDAARVLLAADQPDPAFAWYVVAQHAAEDGDADAKAAVQDLWPAFAVSQPASRFPTRPQDILNWLRDAPAAQGRPGPLTLALLEALGRATPDAAWWTVFARRPDAPATPSNLAIGRLAEAAASGGRLGETVLDSLVLIGPSIADASTADLAEAVAALRAAGQEATARAIARDAVLAAPG